MRFIDAEADLVAKAYIYTALHHIALAVCNGCTIIHIELFGVF